MTSEMVESSWASIGYFLYQLNPDIKRLECLHLKILKKETICSIEKMKLQTN